MVFIQPIMSYNSTLQRYSTDYLSGFSTAKRSTDQSENGAAEIDGFMKKFVKKYKNEKWLQRLVFDLLEDCRESIQSLSF